MANLTEISISTRKVIMWLVIASIVYIILQISFKLFVSYWKATHPIPPTPPDVRFNILPKLTFPKNSTTSAGLVIKLENIEGRPPDATNAAKIYSMPKKQLSILTHDSANRFAEKLGFTQKGEQLNPSYYFYTDPKDNLRTLLLDIINMNYEIKYDYKQSSTTIFPKSKFTTEQAALSEISGYISGTGFFDASLFKEKSFIEYLIFDDNSKTFKHAEKIDNANAMRINYFREKINDLKVLPPGFNNSFNYVLYTPSSPIKFLETSYVFWPVDLSDTATYPLKTAENAWTDLIDGNGVVANMGMNSPDNIIIRNMYLAYYDSEEPQAYLQPIFVFEGDNDFAAYVPAVSSEWIEQ